MSSSDSILAVDPGIRNPAAAIFRRGRLVAASRVKLDRSWTSLDIGERCRRVGTAVHDWAAANGMDMNAMTQAFHLELAGEVAAARALRQEHGVVRLVVEWPQIYRGGKQKGDPNDLPPLAGVDMVIAGRLEVPVVSYRPAEWIGQTKKVETGDALNSPRGKLVWRCLSSDERDNVIVSHDAIDAVGIGLHDLGRLVRRIYPGATS